MKKNFLNSFFWLKVFASALLLVFGAWILFDKEIGGKIVVGVTGAAVIIYYLIRIIPLCKNKVKQSLLVINVCEIVVMILVGSLILYAGLSTQSGKDNWLITNVVKRYNMIVGFVMYARGLLYLITTNFFNDSLTKVKFIVHILFLTLGSVCLVTNFSATKIALILAILSLLSGAYLGVDSGIDYNNYRKSKVEKEIEKINEKEIVDEKQIHVPSQIIEEEKRDIVS